MARPGRTIPVSDAELIRLYEDERRGFTSLARELEVGETTLRARLVALGCRIRSQAEQMGIEGACRPCQAPSFDLMEMLARRRDGWSIPQLAAAYGVSRACIYYHLGRHIRPNEESAP